MLPAPPMYHQGPATLARPHQGLPIAAPVPTELIPPEELEEWRMHARNVIYEEETEAAMSRYMDAKQKIQEKHNNVPLEMRAREAALERMRKGRGEIETYHQSVFKERSMQLSAARNKRQQDINEYKKTTAQPYKAISPRRVRKAHQTVRTMDHNGLESQGVAEVVVDAADADSDDEELTLRAMARQRLQDRDCHNDEHASAMYYDRMVTSGGTAPLLIPRDPYDPAPVDPAVAPPLAPPMALPPPPFEPPFEWTPAYQGPVPGFVPGQIAAPFLAPHPGYGSSIPVAAAVTDVTGKPVSPVGRTLLADHRSPGERNAQRAAAVQNADQMLSERRGAEAANWEDRRNVAKQRARTEWETEEANRREQMETDAAERLMGEMNDLQVYRAFQGDQG